MNREVVATQRTVRIIDPSELEEPEDCYCCNPGLEMFDNIMEEAILIILVVVLAFLIPGVLLALQAIISLLTY